jgi:hypothetical protein
MTYNAEQVAFMLHEAIDQNSEYKSWHCSTQHLMTLVERVVAEEREACAKACEDVYTGEESSCDWPTPEMCATAIRARGQL